MAMIENPSSEATQGEAVLLRPRLSFESITFSDGTTLTVADDDIVVLVGPNNAGKSASLRELESWIANSREGVVVKGAKLRKIGTSEDLRKYLLNSSQVIGENGNIHYGGMGFHINDTHLRWFDNEGDRSPVASYFAKILTTESRITDSNAAHTIALHQVPPTHPIHMLLMDPNLAKSISEKFRHAFGKDLTPFRAGGGTYPLYVGQRPTIAAGQDELSKDFIENLKKSNVLLENQGDGMRSFATVLLHTLAASSHSVQFLDEPEAFLHPPQARLIGRYIAENRQDRSQLFIATHSTDILEGLIEGGSDKVRIVRLRREGDINRVKELNNDETKAISKDTLARFSRVFEGIFFEHVIICESDADCMFYQSVLNLPSISGDRRPDVLFVHSSGKHRMAKLADTLRSLDVPVSIIADIDVLNDEGTFKNLFQKLGGEWAEVSSGWKAVNTAVIHQRPPLNAGQVAVMIADQINDVAGTGEFPDAKERAIKEVFKTVSPWSAMKRSGRNALPGGEPTRQFDVLNDKCSAQGLWIVPVGEIEGFCRSIGAHGPAFVEKVLESKNLENDPELSDARNFIHKIWTKAKSQSGQTDKSLSMVSASRD